MAAKCAYVEKVGAIYYVRKRIPQAWTGRVESEVVRLSLRTKDRVTAIKRGLEALAVFEELLRMEPKDALMHLTRRLIDEQMLRPEAMTGDDLARRRALESVGAKIIKRARQDLDLGENLDGIYQELVHFNRVTVEGEAIYDRLPPEEKVQRGVGNQVIDLSGFNAVLEGLGAAKTEASTTNVADISASAPVTAPAPRSEPVLRPDAAPAVVGAKVSPSATYTLRYLMEDYFQHAGKKTGSDNRSNIERALKLFEDLCPEVKILPVTDIPLAIWDGLHEFVQHIPDNRGRPTPENLVTFTRAAQATGKNYTKLSAATLNSNYLGAITRLVNHGNNRRLFNYRSPALVVSESKRATSSSGRAPFIDTEIAAITSCPVYTGGASRHHRYSPGKNLFADDHIYWAPLVSMHEGMRVTEIGLLEFDQLQDWYGRPTLVLELDSDIDQTDGARGYKTGNALRRVPIHQQLIDIGFLDFWDHQRRQGHAKPFPDWSQHIKGKAQGTPEIHFDADFFNAHRLKWNVPKERQGKLTFHSFRGFFIQACHDARIDPYTILKMVGHDEDTKDKISKVHRGYMRKDLTRDEVNEIDKVVVPLGSITPFRDWLKRQS
jgi:hypothetical protein